MMTYLINILAVLYHLCAYTCAYAMLSSDSYAMVMGGATLFTFVSYQLAVTIYDNNNDDDEDTISYTS